MPETYDSAAEAEADRTQQRILRIEIAPTSFGARGQIYAVHYFGEPQLESRTPVLAACRALLSRRVTGRLEVWRPGR